MYRGERGEDFLGEHRWGMAAFLKQLQSWGVPAFRSTSHGAVAVGLGIVAVLVVSLSACSETPTTSTRPTSLTSTPGGVGGGAPSTSQEPTASATPTPTPITTVRTTPAPTRAAAPTAAPVKPTQKPAPPVNTCGAAANPWGYNFCGGNVISNPPSDFCGYFSCIASFWTTTNGYVEQCVDGLFSHSGGRSGSCSKHGGNRRPLYAP